MDLPVRHAPPLLRLDPPVALRARRTRASRRTRRTRYQRVKYYLMYAFLARGGRGQRHRRALRSDLHRGARHRPRRHPRRAVRRAARPRRRRRTSRSRPLQIAADHTQDFLAQHGVADRSSSTSTRPGSSSSLLVAILFMNRFIPRFWCRVLCPLGAFLGVFARFALFGMEKDHAKCTDCNLCLVHCQGADSPAGRREVAAGRVPHVPELRDRVPRGRHQVPLPAEPQERASPRPTLERRTRARDGRRRRRVHPGRAHRRLARRQLPRRRSSGRRARSRSARSSSAASAAPSA